MSDRVCIRGCAQKDVHYAACKFSGPNYKGPYPCKGCAPRECRDGSLICDRCFGRIRGLITDASDLLARLRSIGDPTKARVYEDVKVGSAPVAQASAPIGDDLLDAIATVEMVLRSWGGADREQLAEASNNLEAVSWLSAYVLDRHAPDSGERELWSVQDAVDRWGVERRDRPRPPAVESRALRPSPEYDESTAEPIPEWGDPLLSRDEAEEIAGSARTLRRWVKAGEVAPAGSIYIAGIQTSIYRHSEIVATVERMRARKTSGLVQNTREGDEDA